MKFKITHILSIALFSFVCTCLSAQVTPTIYINDQMADPGQIIELDVRVTDYTDIISTAFTLNWEASELGYVGVDNIALDLSEDDNFNAMDALMGKLTFLYFDQSLSGESLLDDEVLFTLRLEVLGGIGVETGVTFGGLMEVVDISEMALTVDFDGALVMIGSTNTTELTNSGWAATVSPNPFNKEANIQLNLTEGGELKWSLLEINGQQIATGIADFGPGANNLKLENTLFTHSGSYLLKLQLEDTVLTKRLMYVAP